MVARARFRGVFHSIHTSPPAPGGSVTITYDVKGSSHTLATNMTSDQVAGVSVTKQPPTVT